MRYRRDAMHRIAAAAVAALLLLPATASAGTYHVYTCAAGGKVWPNSAWRATAAAGVSVDSTCAGNSIALAVPAGTSMANNASAALTFTSPPGTTIADFALTRQLDYTDTAAANTHQYYVTYALGSTVFAGAGDYDTPTRTALNAQKQWYGYPMGTAHVAKSTVVRASLPALARYTGNATQLILRAGCFNRGSTCTVAAGGRINHILYGSDVTINDPTPPTVSVEASGLLAGGSRSGSDPVTVTATDGSGIRRVDLIDVTNPAAPVTVGSEDYGAGLTDTQRQCDYSAPAPCPQLSRETVRPTALPAGQRTVVVRVTDAGGNSVDSGPYPVFAVTPSDRGAPNGAGATATATIFAAFPHTKKGHETVGFGRHVTVRGRLLNQFGQPISGARVALLTRDLRAGATVVPRQSTVTKPSGDFAFRVAATASRLLQFGWLEYANDMRFTANGFLTLRARATASLHASTRRPRLGRRLTVSGRIHGVGRGGVTVVLQGRPKGTKRYQTFAVATASRHGRFSAHYRFRDPSSRGRRFQFRARIRPAASFPYEAGHSSTVTVRVR
jgi:hypothetical protein